MKIISYNVNGIRSAASKGLFDYLKQENPNVVCLQEIKAEKDQADLTSIEALGYNHHWFSAQKKGYSGVAIFSKEKPKHVEIGCGHELFDFEGRMIRADFKEFSVYSIYFPSGTTGDVRQEVKYRFLEHVYNHISEFRKTQPNLVVCGDYNICHQAIDIHDPKGNKDSSGFLPEERAWMDKWFESGMVDTFRQLNPEKDKYTWWSFRANARNNNKGWRIDYVSITQTLLPKLKSSFIHPDERHSDHCPSGIVLEM